MAQLFRIAPIGYGANLRQPALPVSTARKASALTAPASGWRTSDNFIDGFAACA
jgi:hypothetical protein